MGLLLGSKTKVQFPSKNLLGFAGVKTEVVSSEFGLARENYLTPAGLFSCWMIGEK